MRDQTSEIINDADYKIMVSVYSTEGTLWVLVRRGKGLNIQKFDSFGVETPKKL